MVINTLRRINFTTLISLITPALIIGAATYTAVSTWLLGLGWHTAVASVYAVLCAAFAVALELNGIKATKQLINAALRRDWPLMRVGAINVTIYMGIGMGALLIVHALPVGIIALGIAAFVVAPQGYFTDGIEKYEARQREAEDRETAVRAEERKANVAHGQRMEVLQAEAQLAQDALDNELKRQLKADSNKARLERLAGKGEKVPANQPQIHANGTQIHASQKKLRWPTLSIEDKQWVAEQSHWTTLVERWPQLKERSAQDWIRFGKRDKEKLEANGR